MYQERGSNARTIPLPWFNTKKKYVNLKTYFQTLIRFMLFIHSMHTNLVRLCSRARWNNIIDRYAGFNFVLNFCVVDLRLPPVLLSYRLVHPRET